MLRKLMKHEFRATGRIMLPLYLILIVTSFGANLTTRGLLSTEYRILDVLGVLLVMAFAIAIMAVCVMSMVVMVQRFYKNLLQDEGYVMMTLPVSVHQQIWSKLIVSAVWFAATVLMIILACCIVAFNVEFVDEFFRFIGDIFRGIIREDAYFIANGTAFAVEGIVLCFLGSCAMCLQFYAALAVGHSSANHKMVWSVGMFFLFQFVIQFLGSMLVILADGTGLDVFLTNFLPQFNGVAAMHAVLIFCIVLTVIYGAIFYAVTTFFLKKRLNLE